MLRLLGSAICLQLAAGSVAAQDPDVGEALFRRHCATCHGLEARGEGPMAGVLLVEPVNLTELQAANGGAFPLARVVARIDGRDPLVSHGSPMPVYGDYFAGDRGVPMKAPSGQPVMMSEPVADLVAYLLSVQRVE